MQSSQKWTSRKFAGWLFCIVLLTALRVADKLDMVSYVALMEPLFYAYFLANVGSAIVQKWSGKIRNNPSITE